MRRIRHCDSNVVDSRNIMMDDVWTNDITLWDLIHSWSVLFTLIPYTIHIQTMKTIMITFMMTFMKLTFIYLNAYFYPSTRF